jgi:parallel beta-helix repeat protein
MNKVVFALIVVLLFSSVLVVTSGTASAAPSGIIRIKTDGTIEGTNKIVQNGAVYTLTGNLEGAVGKNEAFIFIEKDNIILDGAEYSVQGSGQGTAIYMLRSQNVSIINFHIKGFETGINFWTVTNWPSSSSYIGLPSASKNQILNNSIEAVGAVFTNSSKEAGWCIYLCDAIETMIAGNTFTAQDHYGGIFFDTSTSQTNLVNNTFVGCGVYSLKSNQTSASGNMVDGKPLIYLEGKSNKVIESAGLVYLYNCSNIVVKNVKPTYDYGRTILLVETQDSEILNCRGHAVLINSSRNIIHDNLLNSLEMVTSSYNRVFANKITFYSVCIRMYAASNYNDIYGNVLLDTVYSSDAQRTHEAGFNTAAIQIGDINLGGSHFNNIHDNTIINHDCALEFFLSSNNTVTANNIKNCKAAIQLGASHQNNFTQNNVTSCKYAVSIYAASNNNSFYYNNFVGNQIQCFETHQETLLSTGESYSAGNSWDNGKTGNYWDTYTGIDANGDGIGDTPNTVFKNMTDHYPLMSPFASAAAHSNGSISIPAYQDPTSVYPTPTQKGTPEQLIDIQTLAIIVAVGIIFGIIGGLLLYFRRLIWR